MASTKPQIQKVNGDTVVSLSDEQQALEIMTFDIPEYVNSRKGSKFSSYLQNNVKGIDKWEIDSNVGEIYWEHPYLKTDSKKSIGYGLYLANEPQVTSSLFYLDDNFTTKIGQQEPTPALQTTVSTFFTGSRIELPRNNSIETMFRSFEDFTSVEETTNLSLWTLVALKFLTPSPEACRLGKEIQILETQNSRDGRLDVCLAFDKKLLVLEAKTSLAKALAEDRFRQRISSYDKEIKKAIFEIGADINSKTVLLIGSDERALFYPGHKDFLEDRYALGKVFLEKCESAEIQFITANFIWCCLMKSLVTGIALTWTEFIWDLLHEPETLGLCSAGQVTKSFEVRPIR